MSALQPADMAVAIERATTSARRLLPAVRLPDPARVLAASLRTLHDAELESATQLGREETLAETPIYPRVQQADGRADNRRIRAYIDRRVSQWETSVRELLARLAQDWPLLKNTFGLHADASLVELSGPLGDFHHDGRSVYRLRWSDGGDIIYKPRSVENEDTFGHVIRWLHEHGCQPTLAQCAVAPRANYGWTQFIATTPCESRDEAHAFYRRQGGFLAVFWLLCGDDLTSDNVVVHRDHPVWVDTECMCHPEIACARQATATLPEWIRESVMTTAMLFLGKQKNASPRRHTGLHVCCARRRALVYTPNEIMQPIYADAVVIGFRECCSWILANRDAWLAADGPVASWRGRRVRVLLRPTALYSALSRLLLLSPPETRTDVERATEHMLRTGIGSANGVEWWPDSIVRGEMRALLRGDVPYWVAETTSHDLHEANGTIANDVSSSTGMECLVRRSIRLDGDDIERQTWLIRSSLGQC